jgi:glyoxylase-like metal-dependent hydrolase (beta-lactamase superfamily II)
MVDVEVTGTAQRAAWEAKVLPEVEQVRPGLWSIPVPMPNNPLRYVIVYAFESDQGLTLVDAGWNTEDAWAALNDGLKAAGGSISDVRGVMVTHIHPDHYGLAGRIRNESGAWIGLHPADASMLEERYAETDELVRRMTGLLELSGVPEDRRPDLATASMEIRSLVDMALPDRLVEDGDAIDAPGWGLRALWTPGHSPGHLCLVAEEAGLVLSGDHVLPRISPNISFHSQQFPNPLGDFLDSLLKMSAFEPEEVLPAHEYRFRGLAARARQLIEHHEERCREIERLLAEQPGASAWELTLRLTWSRPFGQIPSFMQRAANGETLAHLVLLETRHRVQRQGDSPARFHLLATSR